MSLLLRALEVHVPKGMERRALRRLFEVTADGFGRDPGDLSGLDRRALLDRYASYTRGCAERLLADGEIDRVSDRMWNDAYLLGTSLRRRLRVRGREDELRAARLVYRMIGIDLWADGCGQVTVARCAFAERYSPQVCALMSSLDAGLIAGLTRGGRLTFSERITQGRPRCLARISWEGASS
ncbi:MAG TPA: hypothetical protein VFM40_07945 [Actinomycetota bacterium]|nr:hypothetical protein [Actinomycetota bacterium]